MYISNHHNDQRYVLSPDYMLLTRAMRIKKWSPETQTSGRKRVNSRTKRGLFRELNEAPMQQILSVLVCIPGTHQPEPLVDGSWCTNAPAPSPLGWNHLEVQVQHSLPEFTVVTYPLLDAFPVFLPFPTPLPLSPGIIFPIHYQHLSCFLRSASETTQTKTSYEVRIIVPTLQTRERRLKVTRVLLPCPPSWILGFTPSYVNYMHIRQTNGRIFPEILHHRLQCWRTLLISLPTDETPGSTKW